MPLTRFGPPLDRTEAVTFETVGRQLLGWLLGPLVKQSGFATLLWIMAGISIVTFLVVTRLPEAPAHPASA